MTTMTTTTYRLRADEVRIGHVIPAGGLIGTVIDVLPLADLDGRTDRVRLTVRTGWGTVASDVAYASDAVVVLR